MAQLNYEQMNLEEFEARCSNFTEEEQKIAIEHISDAVLANEVLRRCSVLTTLTKNQYKTSEFLHEQVKYVK